MKIKEIADRLDVSARAIRFYEQKGLVQPAKESANGYRTFSEEDAWKLQTIVSLKEIGFRLNDIAPVLRNIRSGDGEAVLEFLEAQRSAMYARWVETRQMIETLERVIERASGEEGLSGTDLAEMAEGVKQLKAARADWKDMWNYDVLAESFDRLASEAGETGFGASYRPLLELAAQRIAPASGERGLDAGTGTGNLAGLLASRGARMAGIDQSREMLRRCNSKYPEVETKLGNVLAIPYFDSTFHFVASSFALQHLHGRQLPAAIQEMDRVLRPGGRMVIVDRFHEGARSAHPKSMLRAADPLPLLERLEAWGYEIRKELLEDSLGVITANKP
ncbi:MerR family transcriptional regulator [Paenibacillus oceani]|uniref:Methyltransferase domain-containing protein n=1 Tax=Paenibacillus oceani TaxID=2772510 RepID=A0A927CGA5_9BACL|nr:methyltransferase domain-containing protein [Paenibacillus oceani]MBD2865421.1 methyltransferase domain-containing protein [Paenibacillus oceani]